MADAASLARVANDREVWRNLTDRFPHPYTVDDAVEWIERCEQQGEPPLQFAIVVDDQIVGGAGFELGEGERRRSVDIGYWLGSAYWGRGLASAVVDALTHYAFDTFDLNRIQASVFGWNRASAGVLHKCGYRIEGWRRLAVFKDGQYTDLLMWGLLREELES